MFVFNLHLTKQYIIMAKGNIAFTGLRGKVGNFVFSKWKGIETSRGYNPAPANPNTLKQQIARSRITVLVAIYRENARVLSSIYAFKAVRQSAYNAFISAQNKDILLDFDAEGLAVNIAPLSLLMQNQNIPIGQMVPDILGGVLHTYFGELTPNRQYVVNVVAQLDTIIIRSSKLPTTFTTDNDGKFNVPIPSFTGPASGALVIAEIIDQVSGLKYVYSGVI